MHFYVTMNFVFLFSEMETVINVNNSAVENSKITSKTLI